MRALVVARASGVHQRRKENSSKEAKIGVQDKQISEKEVHLLRP
jgi:hypothetical protein